MIRKIISALAICFLAITAGSCADSQEKTCEKIVKAFENNNMEQAQQLCDKLYNKLPDCTVKTLGDLTLSYFTLAVYNSSNANELETYDMMDRTVKCYDAAMKKDPTAAKALWQSMNQQSLDHGHPFDLPAIADAFRTQIALHEAMQKVDSIAEETFDTISTDL